jgi:PAS domain S-box-containing protein
MPDQLHPQKTAEPLCRAEESRQSPAVSGPVSLSSEEVTRLLHELEVQQIELEKKNQALCAGEAHYRALFANMTEAYALWELVFDERGEPCDFRFLEVNSAFETVTGRKRSEVLGRRGLEVYPGAHAAALEAIIQTIATGESVHFERQNPDTGKYYRGCLYRPAEGLAATLFRDVTRRKLEQIARSDQEAQLRLLVEHAPAALAMFDDQMRYLYASRRWVTDYGLEKYDLRGRSHYDLFPELPERWKDAHCRVLRGEVLSAEADRFERTDGSVYWLKWELRPWYDADGKVGGLLIATEDISERKRTEAAIRESEERFRLAAVAARTMVFDVDLRAMRIDSLHGVQAVLGHDPAQLELTIEWWEGQIHPDDRGRYRAAVERMLSSGATETLQYRMIHKDGHTLTVQVVSTPVQDSAGAVTRIVGTVVDITGLRRAEVELRRSQDRLRALTTRQETAAERERLRIARELHDQLGPVLTGMKMDLAWIVKQHGASAMEWVPHVQATMKTIDSTIAMVRRLATELRPQMLDAIGLVAAIEWYAAQFQRRTAIPCAVHAPDIPLDISNDHQIAVFRIFQEALTNIARHSSATSVLVTLTRTPTHATLTITDDGIGFDPDLVASSEGLGILGMRERALLMGAEFLLQSQPHAGTTIALTIQLNGSTEREPEEHEHIDR